MGVAGNRRRVYVFTPGVGVMVPWIWMRFIQFLEKSGNVGPTRMFAGVMVRVWGVLGSRVYRSPIPW